MGQMIAQLLQRAMLAMRSGGVGSVVKIITLAELIDWAQEMLSGPDGRDKDQTAEDAARAVAHILDDPDCLHPVYRRGDNRGEPITPTHHVVDIVGKKCFFTANYHTKGHVDAAYRKGLRAGIRRGTEEAQRAVEAAT